LRPLIFLLIPHAALLAQEPPRKDVDIEFFIQNLLPDASEDADYGELYESLFQLYAEPLDINRASRDELAALMLLSETQLNAFFAYREKLGALLSLYELQAIPELDLATIYRLIPFVTVQPRAVSLTESLKNPSQHYLMLRSGRLLEKQKGFAKTDDASGSRYAGKPLSAYLKYRNSRAGAYSYGITLEKDAGEKAWSWQGKRQIFGVDFSSFHAQVLNQGKVKNLIIGDYQMQAGQGLVLAAGFSLGKGAEVISSAYRSTLGLKPYTSVLEANFFRGTAITITVNPNIEVTGFISNVKRDATTNAPTGASNNEIVSSLPVTGYHRTVSEREKHNNLSEQNFGAHFLYKRPSKSGQLGLTILNTTYNLKLKRRDALYNRYEFSGKQNLTIGLHGDYRWQNMHFFGEAARSKSGGTGAVGGLIIALGKKFDFSLLGRHYDRHFHSFYGNAFGEGSRPINETGGYAGLRYMPSRKWQFNGFYDYFKFPWLKYLVDAPSKGYDFYVHALWKPNKRFNAYALYHQKKKQRNPAAEIETDEILISTIRKTMTVNVEYEKPLRFSLKTRFQSGNLAYLKFSRSNGFTVLQDITCHFPKIELSGRIAYFKSDDYDSRQYVYEKDMLYAFSIPAYYDVGTRHYLMARYAFSKNMKLWIRWSQTRYANLDKISSGLNEIQGNKRSELKAQVMYQF
jgi:hypothetical protein